MKELTDAIAVYTFGVSQVLQDGTLSNAHLPDGTLPTYSSAPIGTHGSASTGLTQEATYQTSNFGFGRDLSCAEDFTPDFSELDPNSSLVVAQAIFRRLSTPRGLFAIINDDPEYGIDIVGLLQRGLTAQAQLALPAQIKAEILKDDRVDPATLKVKASLANDVLSVDVAGFTSGNLPFALTMNASDSGTLLKQITGT